MQFPNNFIESIRNAPGFNESNFIIAHEQEPPVTSIRINPLKITNISSLFNGSISLSPVQWNPYGYYLSSRPSFTTDPLFHAGGYYVQEASSMFLHEVIKQTTDHSKAYKALDLCAAPGGKSTLLLSALSESSLLVSNEVIKSRAQILTENISKWGAGNAIVTNNDPRDFQKLPSFFDIIVADAPCSGSGLFRKDPSAANEWSMDNVALCCQRQQRILSDVIPALSPGGILIYSTCSYSESENEGVADLLTKEHGLETIRIDISSFPGIFETVSPEYHNFGYRFYPDKIMGEGFFIAIFKKPESPALRPKFKSKTIFPNKEEQAILKSQLKNVADFTFIKNNNDILAIPSLQFENFQAIQSVMFIKKAGIRVGSIAGRDIVPAHELAMATSIKDQYPKIEVDETTALNYLRRAPIQLDGYDKGWAKLCHLSLPIGFVKILPNRVNNYYPAEWRIINK